ncbi:MAG: protein BatD [bacterium]|nr:protein BatD [bacterium]
MRLRHFGLSSLMALWMAIVAMPANAQKPGFEVSLEPKRLGVEDLTRLIVTVTEPSKVKTAPTIGECENFEVVAGPSTENQFSIVNGVTSTTIRFVYILQPLDVGPAKVGPIEVVFGDETLVSDPIDAEVVPGSLRQQRPQGRQRPRSMNPFGDLLGESRGRRPTQRVEVILRHLVPRHDLVMGEAMLVEIVLDSNVASVDHFDFVEQPSYPGWWAQRVELARPITPALVEIKGTRYYRYTISQHVLIPLKEGELTVPEVQARIGVRGRSVFDAPRLVERSAKEVKVAVEPLPPAPEGFSGAVGQLRYSASLEPAVIEFGQPAVLTIELEGSGNLPLVESPVLWPSCEECEAYPPEEESSYTIDASGIHGKRVWRTTFVPRTWGELELSPVMLAIFDPSAHTYRRQTLGLLDLTVSAPPATPTPLVTVASERDAKDGSDGDADGVRKDSTEGLSWLLVGVTLIVGAVVGGGAVWLLLRRKASVLPPARDGQTPSERARELQLALERWWLDAQHSKRAESVAHDMEKLREQLETVRFAPGRADHTETVVDLENRLRKLMKRMIH